MLRRPHAREVEPEGDRLRAFPVPVPLGVRAWEKWAHPVGWVEFFLVGNIAFLAVDIALAHSANAFGHRAEWVPIVFSLTAAPLLVLAMAIGGLSPTLPGREDPGSAGRRQRLARRIGLAVGWGSVLVGVAGLLWHLQADFFQQQTLKSLVYTTPFAAPLAYTGLGLLLILDRMIDARTIEWTQWVVLLAGGGFVGNFVLALADHAQNGFFEPSEWIGVVAAAFAIGFLAAVLVVPDNRPLRGLCAAVMAIQVVVGLVGFYLHGRSHLTRPAAGLRDNLAYGAPIFAPLLFADLGGLAVLGLWAQDRALAIRGQGQPRPEPVPSGRVERDRP
jgi:hypothetical protein